MARDFPKTHKTIHRSHRDPLPRQIEKLSGTQATATKTYPGAFLPFSVSSPATFLHQNASTFGKDAPVMTRPIFAIEKTELGQSISSGTTPGNTVRAYHAEPGDEIYAMVATGNTYSPGDLLKPQAGATYGALMTKSATGSTAGVVGICRSTLATAATQATVSKVLTEIVSQ